MFFKEDITEKEIEILARTLEGVIRDEVLEDIHADEGGGYIPDEIMGEIKDKIRNSLYNHLTAFKNVEDGEPYLAGWDIMINHLDENDRKLYPIEPDEWRIAFFSAFYARDMEKVGEISQHPERYE